MDTSLLWIVPMVEDTEIQTIPISIIIRKVHLSIMDSSHNPEDSVPKFLIQMPL